MKCGPLSSEIARHAGLQRSVTVSLAASRKAMDFLRTSSKLAIRKDPERKWAAAPAGLCAAASRERSASRREAAVRPATSPCVREPAVT